MQAEITGRGTTHARRQATVQRTRRFAFVGAAAAAVALLVASTVTFTAQNGTVSGITITGGTSAVIVTDTATSASAGATPTRWVVGSTTAKTAPSWSPTVGQPTSIATDGDLMLVDTRGKTASDMVTVTVALQNAASLTYSTFILPIQLRSASAVGTPTTWNSTAASGGATQYLTLTSPVATFQVAGGALYELMVPGTASNGLVVASTTTTLTPAFLVQTN